MRKTKQQLNVIKQQILDICITPKAAKEIAESLNVEITTIHNSVRALVKDGYMAVSQQHASKNTFRYNLTIKPIYDTGEVFEVEVNPKNIIRVSSDDYHTRGFTPKRSSWVASSLQGF